MEGTWGLVGRGRYGRCMGFRVWRGVRKLHRVSSVEGDTEGTWGLVGRYGRCTGFRVWRG